MLRNILEFYATIGVPILYLFVLFVMYQGAGSLEFPLWFVICSTGTTGLGLIIWGVSYINLGKSFGVLPKKQKATRSGLYRYMKHPMYVGIGCTFVGLSLAFRSAAGLIATVLFLIPLLILRARLEEKKLTS